MGNGISVLYKEKGRTLTRDALGQQDNLRYCIYLIKNDGHVTHALFKLFRTSTLTCKLLNQLFALVSFCSKNFYTFKTFLHLLKY